MRLLSWHERAVEAIEAVHRALPPSIGFKARRAAIRDAYPFGSREHYPYKAWLKAQRAYLARYSDKPAGPLDARP